MHLKYRPEIDGLRAIAVIAVLIYHAEFILGDFFILSGGYIGVDIFFVISGYLITRIIQSEIQDGRFSFLNFYERRARRILPALLIVMLASMPFAWIYMLPDALENYAISLLSSLLFGSNFWFAQGVSYGDSFSQLNPFLHTWSLSVEEQFYIFFPVLLISLWAYAQRRISFVLIVLALLSLQLSQYLSANHSDYNFYLLPSRGWELLVGAFLAKIEIDRGRSVHSVLSCIMPVLGLVMLGLALFLFDHGTPHPSYITLLPVLGTAFIIWFSGGRDPVTAILKSKICVGIGLISYSLYLWHFPIFAFARIADRMQTPFDKLEYLAYSAFLAVLTYALIEQPFRKKSIVKTRLFLVTIGSVSLVITGFCCAILMHDGYKSRLPQILQNGYMHEPWMIMKNDQEQNCFGTYDKEDFCHFKKDRNTDTLIVVGDSNIESFSHILTPLALDAGYNVITMNSSACYFMPDFYSVMDGKPREIENEPCGIEFQQRRLDTIAQYPGATILLGGGMDEYLTPDRYSFRSRLDIPPEAHYRQSVTSLLNNGHRVLQLGSVPRFGKHVSQTVLNFLVRYPDMTEKQVAEILSYDTAFFASYTENATTLFQSIQHPNYKLLDPGFINCDTILENRCVSNDGTDLYVFDFNHPTRKGGEALSALIVKELTK